MRAGGIAIAGACAGLIAGQAHAGAWPLPKGGGQVIVKYERQTADEAFDADGSVVPLFEREDERLSAFVEYGLGPRLTLQAEGAYTRGEDAFVDYDGRGPVSLGLRYTAFQSARTVVSVYAGATAAGDGRNADFAAPAQGDGDVELRVLAGRSGVWRGRNVFAEVQAARLARADLPDETRVDATLGVDVTPEWLVLLQNYAGQAEGGEDSPQWAKAEVSLVRRFGPWRAQAGWRHGYAGRNVPLERGPVIGVWREF